jgi:hypothetical protein
MIGVGCGMWLKKELMRLLLYRPMVGVELLDLV